ncbi:hypothetical protein B0H17DRAFT_1040906 [Mycena rosella]|uniref:Uncharacterized protein n=1 Tax=Mycena rosella TaxID=1033263 RepID=A0AAD7GRJ3_MYCRO|nr:hypothetical protein B0H17DRAFT_1040906 [Mycena rosella]
MGCPHSVGGREEKRGTRKGKTAKRSRVDAAAPQHDLPASKLAPAKSVTLGPPSALTVACTGTSPIPRSSASSQSRARSPPVRGTRNTRYRTPALLLRLGVHAYTTNATEGLRSSGERRRGIWGKRGTGGWRGCVGWRWCGGMKAKGGVRETGRACRDLMYAWTSTTAGERIIGRGSRCAGRCWTGGCGGIEAREGAVGETGRASRDLLYAHADLDHRWRAYHRALRRCRRPVPTR